MMKRGKIREHQMRLISIVDRESYNGRDKIAENASDASDRNLIASVLKHFITRGDVASSRGSDRNLTVTT